MKYGSVKNRNYKPISMIYRIENIQLVFENNTRINVKPYKPIIVHDLRAFRRRYKLGLSKHVHFTYEEYSDRQ